ncbi:hypothetical protein CEXT_360151 [Caerostris extrusa]|uniref:Uncharacterized protein n=1 Tax=Caerostris extrusa TaxID=172846 RepID=A0AAV4UJ67_CAEEX|nr:hypothetical protein CEXT_360151 [Caerostris extrusa]
MRTNVYIISVMTATFNRSSGQTCSELQLVHVGKCFWPLLKERHLMCQFKYTIGALDDSRWWSSLDGNYTNWSLDGENWRNFP